MKCYTGPSYLRFFGMTYSSGMGQGPVVGSCVHGNEPLSSIKDGYFLD